MTATEAHDHGEPALPWALSADLATRKEVLDILALLETQRARVKELEAACSELTTENLRLDAERAQLARELLTAAQHERSRLATADHQRDLANRWLDLARSALPAPPTVAEMAGAFAVEKDDDYYADKARYGD